MSQEELDSFKFLEVNEVNLNKYGEFFTEQNLGKKLYYITAHQYRVTVATILYVKKHFRLEWIRRHMNHLAEEMTSHYIREEAFKKKQINLAETLIRRASQDGRKLETDPVKIIDPNLKKELQNDNIRQAYFEINKFLENLSTKKSNLNVYMDLSEIISILFEKQIPLSEMQMGFCAADALLVLCECQEYLDIIENSYDLGIQIPTLETLPLDLKRFMDKVEVIKYNETLVTKDDLYIEVYTKEVNKLKIFLERRLIPELSLLESETNKNGIGSIIKEYKDIEPIIQNIDSIKHEVGKWMKY